MKNEITRKSVLTKAFGMDGFSEEEKVVIEKMITALDKKKGSSGVSEKVQAERAAEVQAIYDFISNNGEVTATQIANGTGMSVQKVAARLKTMNIAKTPAKGKSPAVFYIAVASDEPTEE
jgi:capsular polysaccharide biosynthesis protein